jgi:competence protein ComEA
VLKGSARLKLIFIVVAVTGIAVVTLVNNAGAKDENAEDVLYAAAGADAEIANESTSAAATEAPGAENPTPEASAIFVDVYGAVMAPSVYELPSGSRVHDAIEIAGGLTDKADIRYINRAAALNDGDRVYVPTEAEIKEGDPLPASAGIIMPGASAGDQGAATAVTPGGGQGAGAAQVRLININTADTVALQALNGVGPSTAQKIIDYREANGPFAKTEDLKKVSGIGDNTYEKMKDYICV